MTSNPDPPPRVFGLVAHRSPVITCQLQAGNSEVSRAHRCFHGRGHGCGHSRCQSSADRRDYRCGHARARRIGRRCGQDCGHPCRHRHGRCPGHSLGHARACRRGHSRSCRLGQTCGHGHPRGRPLDSHPIGKACRLRNPQPAVVTVSPQPPPDSCTANCKLETRVLRAFAVSRRPSAVLNRIPGPRLEFPALCAGLTSRPDSP
jgi:hypothetical protein